MQFLYMLESIRTPFLNGWMALITHLGEETFFLAISIFTYWCVSKYLGYYVLGVGFIGTYANQALKLIYRIPRPWIIDPNFTIVEAAREQATGYSFPSGHTQSVVGICGCLGLATKKNWIRVLCIVLGLLVPFSRMYLGVHTPLDVGVGFGMAVLLVACLYPIYRKSSENDKVLIGMLLAMGIVAVAYLLFVLFYQFPADLDAENYGHGLDNGWKMLGATIAIIIGFFLERKYVRFETKAVWWAQILKTVIGLGIVVAIKALLKQPLIALCGNEGVAGAIRYFLVVMVAMVLWPMTFQWFGKLGIKQK